MNQVALLDKLHKFMREKMQMNYSVLTSNRFYSKVRCPPLLALCTAQHGKADKRRIPRIQSIVTTETP